MTNYFVCFFWAIFLLPTILVFGPIYLVDQKLGFDTKFGIWPNFLEIIPIFGKKIPIFGICNLLDHEKLWGVQNYFLRKDLLKIDRNFAK